MPGAPPRRRSAHNCWLRSASNDFNALRLNSQPQGHPPGALLPVRQAHQESCHAHGPRGSTAACGPGPLGVREGYPRAGLRAVDCVDRRTRRATGPSILAGSMWVPASAATPPRWLDAAWGHDDARDTPRARGRGLDVAGRPVRSRELPAPSAVRTVTRTTAPTIARPSLGVAAFVAEPHVPPELSDVATAHRRPATLAHHYAVLRMRQYSARSRGSLLARSRAS